MRTTKLAFVFMLLGLTAGCKESEVDGWLVQIGGMKKEVLMLMNHAPYKSQEQMGFKNYFSKTWDLNWELYQDQKMVKKLNEILADRDLGQLCEKVLIRKEDWEEIVQKCTVNRYFLCADSVREYQQAVEVLKRHLTPQNLKKFNESARCKAALLS